MHYTQEDLAWTDWMLCILIGATIALAAGCDFQAAQATHESVMDSMAKKEHLPPQGRVNSQILSMPVGGTWIEQSGNDGFGNQMKPIRRYIKSADLTERKK